MQTEAKQFGKYRLIKKLAKGGMAEIYLAELVGEGGFTRQVAIKRIHSQLSSEKEFITMFLDEARLSAKLNHPNIVNIYELGKVGNTYYIAMEYIDGVSLSDLIRKTGGVKPEVGLWIILETCSALHYAHTLKDKDGTPLNIVHRDVSPQNILISYDGAVKMIDFGVAKAAIQLHETKAGTFKGKYAYMAPEQCKSHNIDHRADIFALGVVLWETLTGKGLYHRSTIYETMEAVLTLQPPSVLKYVPKLPPEIDDIILKATAKNREYRYQTVEEMQNDLEEYVYKNNLLCNKRIVAKYVQSLFKGDVKGESVKESFVGSSSYPSSSRPSMSKVYSPSSKPSSIPVEEVILSSTPSNAEIIIEDKPNEKLISDFEAVEQSPFVISSEDVSLSKLKEKDYQKRGSLPPSTSQLSALENEILEENELEDWGAEEGEPTIMWEKTESGDIVDYPEVFQVVGGSQFMDLLEKKDKKGGPKTESYSLELDEEALKYKERAVEKLGSGIKDLILSQDLKEDDVKIETVEVEKKEKDRYELVEQGVSSKVTPLPTVGERERRSITQGPVVTKERRVYIKRYGWIGIFVLLFIIFLVAVIDMILGLGENEKTVVNEPKETISVTATNSQERGSEVGNNNAEKLKVNKGVELDSIINKLIEEPKNDGGEKDTQVDKVEMIIIDEREEANKQIKSVPSNSK